MQADYNNDGCMDVLVLRGGWEFPMRPSLLRNNCNGTFTDVTREAGLPPSVRTQTAAWADVDNDGNLDLFLASEDGPSRLFRNTGKRHVRGRHAEGAASTSTRSSRPSSPATTTTTASSIST